MALLLALLFFWQSAPNFESVSALVAAGKFTEAKQELAALDESAPGVAHLRGLVAYNLHDYPVAIDALKKAAKTEAEGSKARVESALLIGQSYYLLSQISEAIPWLQQARAGAGSKRHEIEYMLGNCYIQTSQPAKALAAFAAMFNVPQDSAAAHLLTAQMMVRQEQEDPAIKELHQSLQLNPKLPGAHLLLGELATYKGEIDLAIQELREEIGLNPNSSQAYYKLGDAYSRREQWPEAIPELERSIWLNPSYSGPYIILGKAYLKTRQLANAEGILKRALQLDPQNSSALYLLGQTLISEGRTEQGRQFLQESQQQRRNHSQ